MLVKKRPGRLTSLFFMGALLGAVFFLLIFEFRSLDVTYIDRMLLVDGVKGLPQHYLGWEFFRRTAWSFPLGNMEGLIYPETISVVFADSIPLFAVFFKLFSALLPARFQYFGIFSLTCFMLQGGLGALISDRFFKNRVFSLILSIFFILSPIAIRRSFYHSALSAHFLILAAFAIWLYKSEFKSWKTPMCLFAILNALTVTIHVYFTPMTVGIMLCYALQELLEKKKWSRVLLSVGISFFSILGTAWLFGYFTDRISASSVGLGRYSFNLNGFINPFWYSNLIDTLPVYQNGQIEGFAYLGLGMICLLTIALILFVLRQVEQTAKTKKFIIFNKNTIPALVMLAVFTVLALSPAVSFQARLLFTIPLPDSLLDLLSIFRASGRFIWPIYYAIFIFSIREISIYYRRSKLSEKREKEEKITRSIGADFLIAMIIASTVFVQVYDLTPLFVEKNLLFAEEVVYQSPLKSPIWEELAKTHKHIYLYKPINDLYTIWERQCLAFDLAAYALDHDMDINAVCLARVIAQTKDDQITAHFDTMAQGAVYNDYIYIFMNPDYFPGEGYGLHYYEIDGIIIGVNTPIEGAREYGA